MPVDQNGNPVGWDRMSSQPNVITRRSFGKTLAKIFGAGLAAGGMGLLAYEEANTPPNYNTPFNTTINGASVQYIEAKNRGSAIIRVLDAKGAVTKEFLEKRRGRENNIACLDSIVLKDASGKDAEKFELYFSWIDNHNELRYEGNGIKIDTWFRPNDPKVSSDAIRKFNSLNEEYRTLREEICSKLPQAPRQSITIKVNPHYIPNDPACVDCPK